MSNKNNQQKLNTPKNKNNENLKNNKDFKQYKSMNLFNLQKQENEKFKTKRLFIDNYKIIIDEKFKPTKINKLIEELVEIYIYAQTNELMFDFIMMQYILAIKYFTSIKVPDTYEGQLAMLETLNNNEYLERILNEFTQEEMNKITQAYINTINNTKILTEQLGNQIREVNSQLLEK